MKQFLIDANDASQRLDKFLKKLFPNASRDLLYKLNRKDKIKVIFLDGKKTKQDNEYKLQEWQQVQIYLQDEEIAELQKSISPEIPSSGRGKWLSKDDIVYEDGCLLILNKAPGMNVHPGDHKSDEISVIQQVEDYYAGKLNSLTFKPSLIHRIDRDTSWILMIAKDKASLVKLSSDFKSKTALEKIYFTLLVWKLSRNEGTIKKALTRIEDAKNVNKVQVSEDGQDAITHYKVLEEYKIALPDGEQIISAVEVRIETGRMHQIRVHMAHIGCPVLWDKTYGDKKRNSYFFKNFGVDRQMLHAWKIAFIHPKTGKKMNLTARLKEDMEVFLAKIKK